MGICNCTIVREFFPLLENQVSWQGKVEELSNQVSWQGKVEELSTRGFELKCLMNFYAHLGREIMPHYDPRRSRTNDVVRQAIIPLSRKKGCALASVWQNGLPLKPQVMVSHNWSNMFSNLVAAIVADALEEPMYGDILPKLVDSRLPALVKELERKGVMNRVYWVCAFSVNQHSSICAGFGPTPSLNDEERLNQFDYNRRDTVTGNLLPVCHCPTEKHLHSEPELCEMNKFDDMLRHLSKTTASFRQIVAVDEHFEVFKRAWVVAEIVEAAALAVPQKMIVIDEHFLSCGRKLHIAIEKCTASCPEDVQVILAKIDDIDAFNKHITNLVFHSDGLLEQLSEKIQQRLRDRSQWVLKCGTVWKLNDQGDPTAENDWRLRDIWISDENSLCYWSRKDNERVVLISEVSSAQVTVVYGSALPHALKIHVREDVDDVVGSTTIVLGFELRPDFESWSEALEHAKSVGEYTNWSEVGTSFSSMLERVKNSSSVRRSNNSDRISVSSANVLSKSSANVCGYIVEP